MPYAADNKISIEPFEGSIEITSDEYAAAIEQMTQGKRLVVLSGALLFKSSEKIDVWSIATKEISNVFLDEIPDGFTRIEPSHEKQEWDGEKWVLPQREAVLQQIRDLEAQQTPRRIREAAMSDDGRAWLEILDTQITTLRQQLAQGA